MDLNPRKPLGLDAEWNPIISYGKRSKAFQFGHGAGVVAILLATMGYTAPLVVAPLRQFRDIQEMHVFYGDAKDPKRKAPLEAVRKVSQAFGVKLHEHAGKDGFDYDHFLRSFVDVFERIPEGTSVRFNASSGPRPMIMAATIFCFTHDLQLLYYDEYDTKEGKTIPLRAYRSLRGLGDTKRALLARLKTRGQSDVSALSQALKLAPSTVSVHIHDLETMGLVTVFKDGKRRVVDLLPEFRGLRLETIA